MKYKFNDKTEYGMHPIELALIERVLSTGCVVAKEPVVIEDADMKRIHLTVDGTGYMIRTWSSYESEKTVTFRWSLFCDNEGHELCSSITSRFNKAKYEQAEKDKEKADKVATKKMKYQVWLLNHEAVRKHPEGKNGLRRQNDVDSIDERQYRHVYDGVISVPKKFSHEETLDAIFKALNIEKPVGYTFPALSVGDVVVLRDEAYYCESTGWEWHLWHGIDDDLTVMEQNLREWMKQEKPSLLHVYFNDPAKENADGSFTYKNVTVGHNEYRVADYDDVVAVMMADLQKHGVKDIRYGGMGSGWRMRDNVKCADITFLGDGWNLDQMHFRSDLENLKAGVARKTDGMMVQMLDIPVIDSRDGMRVIKPGTVNIRHMLADYNRVERLERDSDDFRTFYEAMRKAKFGVYDNQGGVFQEEGYSTVYKFTDFHDPSHTLIMGTYGRV